MILPEHAHDQAQNLDLNISCNPGNSSKGPRNPVDMESILCSAWYARQLSFKPLQAFTEQSI